MPGSKREKVKNLIFSCFRRPAEENELKSYAGRGGNRTNNWLWHRNRGKHAYGEFSMAVATANKHNEDRSQLKTGPITNRPNGPVGTFVGVYDGHGGAEASQFVLDHLFHHLKRFATDQDATTPQAIQKAYRATEEGFVSLVRQKWRKSKHSKLANTGSCCLVGVVTHGTLFVANAGDSRAVLGRGERGSAVVEAVDLSRDHNASAQSIRDELRARFPDDPRIVVCIRDVWRVKGIIQVTRSIGDVYLKSMEFQKPPLDPKYRISTPFASPILLAEPEVREHKLQPKDKFVIFASDGLWEHLSGQQAVEIVNSSPRTGAARTLIKEAIEIAAQKKFTRYRDVRNVPKGGKRHFHDDISVVVVFFDDVAVMSSSSSSKGTDKKGPPSHSSKGSSFSSRTHSRTHSLP
ncbi:hypothetical protein LUZ60_003797 [Juncus effusus]|nr:hypothetical protein LUZ60_003797 [Juncus effusus]